MKVLFVTSEVVPFTRTRELAGVSYYLPRYLNDKGIDIRIVTPRYKTSNVEEIQTIGDFGMQFPFKKETCILRESKIDGIPVYLIDNYQYFDRDFMYAYDDDCERFAFFCRAVLEMLKHIDFRPDIIHLNDWHTAPISMILNERYRKDAFYKDIAVVYTIHDLVCQGICSRGFLKLLGVDDDVFTIEKTEYYNMINYMKMGIVYSDLITTVSDTCAKKIQTSDYGNGLDGVLKTRKDEILGVINGIDYNRFNPKTDKVLYKNYHSKTYNEKLTNKYFLQDKLRLPKKDVPMIAYIAPLIEEKGVELLLESMDDICKNDVQLVILGVGNAVYEYSLKFAMSKYMYQVHATIGEDDELLRQIFAASDIFLAPYRISFGEVNQLIALRYGVIPVARRVGSLNDIIVDVRDCPEKGYGYKFDKFSKDDMLGSLEEAIRYYDDKEKWNVMVERAMSLPLSWEKTAYSYSKIYEKAKENRIEFCKKDDVSE